MWGLSSDVKIPEFFSSRLVTETSHWGKDPPNKSRMDTRRGKQRKNVKTERWELNDNFYYLARCQVHGLREPFCHAGRRQAIRGLKNRIHACNFHFLENLPFFRSFSVVGAGIINWFLLACERRTKKKERFSLKPDETATTVPLLSSVFSNDLPVKTKIAIIIIITKLPTLNSMKNQFKKNYITFHDFFI